MDFTHVKTALHLKSIVFQQILAKVGAVIYEYYKNAFVERCEKETFKAYEFDSRQAMITATTCPTGKLHFYPKDKNLTR